MDFHLSEEHKMIQDAARDFAREVVAPRAAELDQTATFPEENFRQAAEQGFAGILVPEEYDGAGMDNLALALIMVEINKACASTGVTLSVHNSLATAPVILHGTEDQK
ncbi:MAG: acyl-CoA dehydrogenase family protein, partial [Planctomycetota bacterium]